MKFLFLKNVFNPDWPSFTASVIYIKCYYSEVFNTFRICRLHTVLRNSTASRRAKTKVWSEMGTWIFSLISYHPPLMQTWIWWLWFSLHCVTQSRKPTWLLPVAASFAAEFVTKPSALSAIYLLNLNLKEKPFQLRKTFSVKKNATQSCGFPY